MDGPRCGARWYAAHPLSQYHETTRCRSGPPTRTPPGCGSTSGWRATAAPGRAAGPPAWLERGKVFVDGEAAGPDAAGRRLEAGMRVGVWIDRPGSARSADRAADDHAPSASRRGRGRRLHRRRQARGRDCRAPAGRDGEEVHAPRSRPAPSPARCARRAARGAPDRSRYERAGALRADRRSSRRAEGPVRAPYARAHLSGSRRRGGHAGARPLNRPAGLGRDDAAPAEGPRHRRARQGGGGRVPGDGAVRAGGAGGGLAGHRQAQPDPGPGRAARPSAPGRTPGTASARPRRSPACRTWAGKRSTPGASGSATRRPAGRSC